MEDQTVKNPDKGGVQSVARIFELIEVLAAHPAGASLQRLAEDAHLAKSTTHRLLGSLVSLGYAAQDGETGKRMIRNRILFSGSKTTTSSPDHINLHI